MMKNENLICTANKSNILNFNEKIHINFTKNNKKYSVSTDEIVQLIDGNAVGCKYCTGSVEDRENLLTNWDIIVYINGNNSLTLSYDDWQEHMDIKINFCPICGKKLEEQQND